MVLTDTVARYLHRAMHLQAVMAGASSREVYEHYKPYIKPSHPIQSLNITMSIKIGDILEPITEGIFLLSGDTIDMELDDKLLVYQISSERGELSLPSASDEDKAINLGMKVLLIRYKASSLETINLNKIDSILSIDTNLGLCGLLTGFKLLGNIRDKM
jgi:hypothetical protein